MKGKAISVVLPFLMSGLFIMPVLKAKELTHVNDRFQNERNEAIGHYRQALNKVFYLQSKNFHHLRYRPGFILFNSTFL